MNPPSHVSCDICGVPFPNVRSWFSLCPDDHDHALCIPCVIEWDLADWSRRKEQRLLACPDGLKVARELMKENPGA